MLCNDNGNYLWIQMFYMVFNEMGCVGFVMVNLVSDVCGFELEICQKLIEDDGVDVMVVVLSNFFYIVMFFCVLWFLDKNKFVYNKDKVLFIDVCYIFC